MKRLIIALLLATTILPAMAEMKCVSAAEDGKGTRFVIIDQDLSIKKFGVYRIADLKIVNGKKTYECKELKTTLKDGQATINLLTKKKIKKLENPVATFYLNGEFTKVSLEPQN